MDDLREENKAIQERLKGLKADVQLAHEDTTQAIEMTHTDLPQYNTGMLERICKLVHIILILYSVVITFPTAICCPVAIENVSIILSCCCQIRE